MASRPEDKWGSHDYAKTHGVTGPPAIEMVEKAHQISPLDSPSAHVLELGCGAGVLTAELARRFPDTPILATDQSQGMLKKVDEQKLGKVETMELDAMDLKPAEGRGQFTHILSTATIQFCSDPLKAIQEGHRLLSKSKLQAKDPTQKFVYGVGSWNKPDVELFYQAVYEELGVPGKFQTLFNPEHWPTDASPVEKILRDAGFKDVVTKQVIMNDGRTEKESEYWHWEFENPGLAGMRKNAMEQFGVEKCRDAARKVYARGREGKGTLGKGPEDLKLGQLLALGCL
ncbi:Hypothetical predicted protein [Lecanosticta acicola]|uniref:Methyltransferase domain-containing protein n=1 Tax=Lecanosticta acicola TaxID=111012 RepID=A0AAI8YZ15_9PEZI|nr:Hypothetical predicted protein [Lecanosticta acicola]